MSTAVLAGSCPGGLPWPYLQEEMSPPCSKCLSRRIGPSRVPHPQPETLPPPHSGGGESPGNGWGSWHVCFPRGLKDSVRSLPSGSDRPTPSHHHLTTSVSGLGVALRSRSLPLPPVQTYHFSQVPHTPGPLHRLSREGSTRCQLCALGQVTPSRASHPHWSFEELPQ